MVADDGGAAMNEAWRDLGTPKAGGVLLIGDHASAIVPADIDLGIDPVLLTQHIAIDIGVAEVAALRSEEHTSELQSLMRISYAVFCLKKKKKKNTIKLKV